MIFSQRTSPFRIFIVILASLFLPFSLMIQMPSVLAATPGTGTLNWTANTEPDLAGYEIFFGDQPGVYNHPDSPISVGKVTSYTFLPGMLSPGVTYSFALKATDLAKNLSGLSKEIPGKLPADTKPPTVSISNPSPGGVVSNVVSIQATAVDDIGVVGVRFLVNNVQLGAEDTTAPFSINWDTTPLLPNSYNLKAIARDAAGNETTSETVTVSVASPSVDNTFPKVSITAPASGVSLSGVVSINASASDNIGLVGVRFLANDVQVGAEDTTAPYAIQWDTSSLALGSYELKAIARDAAGNETTSTIIPVTVVAPPPSSGPITITNLWVDTDRAYTVIQDGLQMGGQPYIDRINWKFTQVPISLVGGTVIRTANQDKPLTTNPFLRFNINQPAAVYVGHDIANTTKPSWLDNFTNTGMIVKIEDATLELYKKDFPAGPVSLGGNGGKASMYTVVVTSNGTPAPVSDTTPPTVSITAPANGDVVSDVASIQATAVDDIGVVGVRFLVNNVQLGAEDTTAPFSINWDTTPLLPNSYNLKAIARDAAGNETTSTIIPVTVVAPPPSSGLITITNLWVDTDRAYTVIQDGLQMGGQPYIDRTNWKFTQVPTSLVGGIVIRTANQDKRLTTNPFLRFNINQPAAVYVGHDVAIGTKPSWLNSFTNTGMVVKIEDATLELYKKDFPAGPVSLGGNGGRASMYTVIVTNP